jgi:group I intron endonuclease
MTGIYKIMNNFNGDCYYGSSINIEKRWYKHIYELKRGSHHNSILQRAWDKYGEVNFTFDLVEECDVNNLLSTEQKYLDSKPKYNIGIKSSGGDNISNNPNRNDIIKNISKGLKLRYSKMTKEEIDSIYSRSGQNNWNWKGGVSKKYCGCGKEISPSNETCRLCYNTKGDKNPFFGKKHTQEVLNYLSEINKGICRHNNKHNIIIDNTEYESYQDASKKLKINYNTIRWRVLSKNPKYENYQFKNNENIIYTDDEQKKRFSISQIGKKRNHNKSFYVDNIEYRTLKEASEKLNIHPMTIKGRLLSLKFNNYQYKQ